MSLPRWLGTACIALASGAGCDVFNENPFGGGSARDPASWTVIDGPCLGSRTNALFFDGPRNGFIGCGENADGTGLHVTVNGGLTWGRDPAFQLIRVNDVRRGGGGALFVGGTDTQARASAWRVEEGAFRTPHLLFRPGMNAFTAVVQADNVAVASDGYAVVTSLTGTTAAAGQVGGDFTELESLAPPEAAAFQVRRLVAHGGRFYGAGSVISDPAEVYLPSRREGAPRHELEAHPVQGTGEMGELKDLVVWDSQNMLAVGHDQGVGTPLLVRCEGDPYLPESWTRVAAPSGLRGSADGVAARGERVVVVGMRTPTTAGGFILTSSDGGRTFSELSPPGVQVRPLSRAFIFEDGAFIAAGGGGHMLLSPAGLLGAP